MTRLLRTLWCAWRRQQLVRQLHSECLSYLGPCNRCIKLRIKMCELDIDVARAVSRRSPSGAA